MNFRTLGYSTLTLIVAMVSAGCASNSNPDMSASNFLGLQAVNVLSNPSRVEGWNYRAPDGTSYSEPAPHALDMSFAMELRGILFDENTYTKTSNGTYHRSVGFRIWRGHQSVDVLLSFGNDTIIIKSLGPSGAPVAQTASCANAHDKLLALAKRAFPGQDVR